MPRRRGGRTMVGIGDKVGSYRVVRAIGSGGMGMVLEAVHERIRSRAAIKILHTQYSQNPELRERFLTEALATNLVQHPGIVSVFEHGQTEHGDAFIIMEYLEGQSLRGRVDAMIRARSEARPHSGGPRAAAEAGGDRAGLLRLIRQLASTLAAAHGKGIIHRDLKPDNIMIVKDPFTMGGERVKVLDFGIAKVLGPEGARVRTGGLLGTPAYMAPEAWAGAATVDAKADVYALGMIVFEALTGELPIEDARDNIGRWQELHQTAPPTPLRTVDPSVPEVLDTLVARMLAKAPHSRPDMNEVAAELDQLVGMNLRYRAGGFVRDGEFYVRRDADDALFYALLNGQSCHVLAPRHSGKTSLLHAVSHRLSNVRGPELERGILCAVLDLHSVASSGDSEERFYFELVRELYRGLGLSGVATDFWADRAVDRSGRTLSPVERFARLLRDLPLLLSQPTVLFIDHLEVLLRLPLSRADFLAALARAMPADAVRSTDRKDDRKDDRRDTDRRGTARTQPLSFCLLGTVLKEDLLTDPRDGTMSPFARSRAVALPDFQGAEARTLLPGLHSLGALSDKALAAVLSWTGGHPSQTQRMCEALSTRPLPDGTIEHFVDGLAGEVVAISRNRQGMYFEDPCFAFAAEGIRRAGELRPALLGIYGRVLTSGASQGGGVPVQDLRNADSRPDGKASAGRVPESERALARLQLLGLLRRDKPADAPGRAISGSQSAGTTGAADGGAANSSGGGSGERGGEVRVRNRIFAAVFSADWLRDEEATSPLQAAIEKWRHASRHPDYLLSGKQLREALSWARMRPVLNSDEQSFIGASVEREERLQRRRVGLLLGAVLILMASLLGTGIAWRNVALAKREVDAQQVRTTAALREADTARREADHARGKMEAALRAANEALQAAETARVATVGAQSEAARQRGAAAAAAVLARQATERAQQAAREANAATQVAQQASRRADEANQNAGRTLSEKQEALAGAEARLQQCQREVKTHESTGQRCQQSLDAQSAEVQSLRGTVATLNGQLSTLNTQVSTGAAALAACQAAAAASAKAGEAGREKGGSESGPASTREGGDSSKPAKETQKEAPKEAPKETGKEAQKEAAKEAAKEPSKEAP